MSVARSRGRLRCCLWLATAVALAGCESYRELFPGGPDAGDASVPGTPLDITWGAWAASLPVRPCPTDAVMVVTSADDDPLDGGLAPSGLPDAGARLTFREAVRIADRHPGAETILFDEGVFPADAPTTIHLLDQMFPLNPGTMCIDARERGVVIDFGNGLGDSVGAMLRVGPDSLLVGLTFLHIPFEFELGSGVQFAGCRVSTDGHSVYVRDFARFWQVEGYNGSRIGPGNVIAGGLFGMRQISSNVTIDGNWFGTDVITRKVVGAGTGIDFGPVGTQETNVIADNVFATPVAIRASYGMGVIRDNLVGIDRDGYRFPSSATMGTFSDFGGIGQASVYLIRGNVVRGADVGLAVNGVPRVTVSRNSISEGGVPLDWPAHVLEPPSLTAVSSTEVSGTCLVAGKVEVFSGNGTGPERFLAEADCVAGGPFTVAISEEPGRFVSASLTDAQGHTSEFSAELAVP